MTPQLTYRYAQPSALHATATGHQLLLSDYSECPRPQAAPTYFWGRLLEPQLVARSLLALSRVVASQFTLSPGERAALRDPIVTAAQGQLRFEGFSGCAGVYARVDVRESGLDGEFAAEGTTNVDFNAPMLAALSTIGREEEMLLSVGQQQVGLHRGDQSIVERQVPLPCAGSNRSARCPSTSTPRSACCSCRVSKPFGCCNPCRAALSVPTSTSRCKGAWRASAPWPLPVPHP